MGRRQIDACDVVMARWLAPGPTDVAIRCAPEETGSPTLRVCGGDLGDSRIPRVNLHAFLDSREAYTDARAALQSLTLYDVARLQRMAAACDYRFEALHAVRTVASAAHVKSLAELAALSGVWLPLVAVLVLGLTPHAGRWGQA